MKIGIDASNIRAGGGLTHLSEILAAANPDVHGIEQVIVWSGSKTLERLPEREWLKLTHDPLLDRSLPFRAFWQKMRLPAAARRSCDVLFTPGGTHPGGFERVVTMSQNLLPFEPAERDRFPNPLRQRYKLLERTQSSAFRRAAGVIFLIETARRVVTARTGTLKGRTVIIPHGISERFRRAPVAQMEPSHYTEDNPFRLVYVSIVNLYKHQWHAAEAVAQLRAKHLPISITFIGPAYPPALERLNTVLTRIDPQHQFAQYLGPVLYDKLPAYYHGADAFLFASSCETISSILIEAMASGLPIVCSNRGPMPEVLGDAGLYFDPENPTEIARSIERLFSDTALRTHSAAAAFEQAQQYTWNRSADETFGFLSTFSKGDD